MILLLGAAHAATLAGTVTDATGAPLAGVDVVAYDARLNYASARTTNDGEFLIGSVPPGRYRIRALPADDDPRVDRFLPDEWDFCDGEVVDLGEAEDVAGLDFALPDGGRITGRLLTPAGEPAGGGQVMAVGKSDRAALVSRVTDIAEDGTFTIVGLDGDPAASEPYAVYVGSTGRPRQYLGPTYDDEMAVLFDVTLGEPTDIGDEALFDGITVEGTVAGPDGPVASGTVYVYSGSQVLSVDIQADGTYFADGLPPGAVIPWASSTGLATTYYPDADRPGETIPTLDEGAALTGADLSLPVESTLTVTLVGEGDLSDASFLLYNDTYTVGRGGGFGETGVATVGALHPGSYYLFVYGSDEGFTDDFVRGEDGLPALVTVDGASTLTVTMPAAASFSGTVRDDEGAPVYGAYVYAITADGSDRVVGVTDANGVYSITGLPGGDFQLQASYAHYCAADQGWVTVYWPDALAPDDAILTTLAAGEARTAVDFTLFRDDDHDAMGDAWEADNGLDPLRDDAGEDPDEDGYLNVEEWILGTDPTGGGGPGDGCGSGCGGAKAGVLLLLLPFARRRRRSS